MVLDSEEQRQILLTALLNVRIEGDYAGISQALPKFSATIEAVKQAGVSADGEDG